MNKYQKESSKSYCLGMSLCIEMLKSAPESAECIYLSDKASSNRELDYLYELAKKNSVRVITDNSVIEKLSIKENCYAIGIFHKFERRLSTDRHVVLYGFDDFGELGTIMRSATSFDFEDIVLIGSDIDYFDPRVVRASMGAIFHMNIVRYDSIDEYKKEYSYKLYPFISNGSSKLGSFSFDAPYSIVIPQYYYGIDEFFDDGYSIEHTGLKEVSLSSLSSIVLNDAYHQNVNGKNISGKGL